MSHLYILENHAKKNYIGITNLAVEDRLKRHNHGDVFSTMKGRPWRIAYIESFDSLGEARKREKLIKSWHGGNAFKKLLSKTAGSSNGRTADSGSAYLGSSPRSSSI